VETTINLKYRFLAGLAFFVIILAGCNQVNDLGMELLPSTDLIEVKNVVLKESISSFTFGEDSIKTGAGGKSLLGSFNDPVFGNTTIDFATQFRLMAYPDFGENPVTDSVKLFLYYRIVYGDTITPQKFRVYELESAIDIDNDYYQNVDLKSMASDQLLGEVEYTPVVGLDSLYADTFYQLITIPLDISLAEKLVNADSLQMINNDIFLDFFKGLYIETEKITDEGGAILTLEASSVGDFQGSALLIYYDNDENKAEEFPDTLSMPYIVSEFSARVNRITHDYAGTTFEANLNSELEQDSLIYIQSTGGLQSKILIDDLSHWQDSTNIAINKAELIFQIDTIASDPDRPLVIAASDPLKFAPPSQLLFTVIDENGDEFLPIDYLFSPSFYGGYLNVGYTYRFNITQHLQQMIEGQAENYGFFLTTSQKSSEANRVVLKGSTSETGIKLIITYSKFLQ
jgi:hypothetical protein